MKTTRRRLHYGQKRLVFDREKRHHVIPAGIRYGKSYLGPPWHFYRVRMNPRASVSLVVGASYRLLKQVNLPIYRKYLGSIGLVEGIDFQANTSSGSMSIVFPRTNKRAEHTVLFLSGDNPDSIVGFTASHAWNDECALQDEDAKKNTIQRVSEPLVDFPRQILWTSVPKGTGNWFYESFGDHKAERQPDSPYSESKSILVLHGSMFDNPYLDQSYRDTITDEFSWDENYYRNYILGEWVNLSTNAFYFKFRERENVAKVALDRETPKLYLTFDFNVGMMSWSCFQIQRSRKDPKPVYAIIRANRSNGQNIAEACNQFMREFPPGEFKNWRLSILGDPSGHARSPQTATTSFDVIEHLLRPHYPWCSIDAPRQMPQMWERSFCTNKLFAERRLLIHPSCTKVIASAKIAESDGRGGIKKPKGETITHAMEAVDMAMITFEPPEVMRNSGGMNYLD